MASYMNMAITAFGLMAVWPVVQAVVSAALAR